MLRAWFKAHLFQAFPGRLISLYSDQPSFLYIFIFANHLPYGPALQSHSQHIYFFFWKAEPRETALVGCIVSVSEWRLEDCLCDLPYFLFLGLVSSFVNEGIALQTFCGFSRVPSCMIPDLDICFHSSPKTFHFDKKSHFLKRLHESGFLASILRLCSWKTQNCLHLIRADFQKWFLSFLIVLSCSTSQL